MVNGVGDIDSLCLKSSMQKALMRCIRVMKETMGLSCKARDCCALPRQLIVD